MAAATDSGGTIDVWVASLDAPPAGVEQLARTLAPAEWEEARRLRSPRDRRRFVVRRSLRRTILARYTGCDPARLEFARGDHGKPSLAGARIAFSCSHSRGLAVYAISHGPPVGVDVEYVRPVLDLAEIARTLFCPDEYHELCALPPGDRQHAFFRCWTRKEAYVKARGTGLAERLDGFAVTLAPNESARVAHVDGDREEAAGWSIADFAPAKGFVAAAAVEAPAQRLRWQSW